MVALFMEIYAAQRKILFRNAPPSISTVFGSLLLKNGTINEYFAKKIPSDLKNIVSLPPI